MSASEALKALDAATPLEKYEIDLFGILSQIAAVVEEAEMYALEMHGTPPVPKHPRLVAALTALEEALS